MIFLGSTGWDGGTGYLTEWSLSGDPNRQELTKCHADLCFLTKKISKNACSSKKISTFATAIQRWMQYFGIWCNGNTTDSGPVIPGSNPGIPTTTKTACRSSASCFFGLWSCPLTVPFIYSFHSIVCLVGIHKHAVPSPDLSSARQT